MWGGLGLVGHSTLTPEVFVDPKSGDADWHHGNLCWPSACPEHRERAQ